ncbi:TetR/AcrR family transcriptional regulator [Shewanella maritima]|uniref:TetR/AcrR family transcriptional regulator n=1 Tax=Shewanella maritima TaxID=2520507 RepID=A0A411PLY2_9GAMM|nr:TetR/AcrR family transcriptional regulator [Shewanella maritima]QBF84488.1 TetR/AcrR family transcriptional regulator [Shewanella maritima]
MGKITAQERKRRQALYDSIVLDIYWNEGWDAISLGRVAKRANIARSTLQSYYPNGLTDALKGRVMPTLIDCLDMSSREALIESWNYNIRENVQFSSIIKILIENSLKPTPSVDNFAFALNKLVDAIEHKLGNGKQTVTYLLGSVVLLKLNML